MRYPVSREAEECLLGAMLHSEKAISTALEIVTENDFFFDKHRLLFRAIVTAFKEGTEESPFDVLKVLEVARRHGFDEKIGGLRGIIAFFDTVGSGANVKVYASLVKEKALLRNLMQMGRVVTNMASRSVSPLAVVREVEKHILSLSDDLFQERIEHVEDIAVRVAENFEKVYENRGLLTGISTGYSDIDRITGGLHPGELIILAARPGMGKTALALNIAANVARNSGRVAFFSLEMSKEQLVTRLLCGLAGVDIHKLRTGYIEKAELERVRSAREEVSEMALFIDDQAGISPQEVRAKLRRLELEEGKLSLVVIDYLQLMRPEDRRDNREQEIASISAAGKILAKIFNVPVLLLSQLNRNVETRMNKRPKLGDLRESGAIEQDADIVMFIYRDEVYNPGKNPGVAEIIVEKNRNGPTGTAKLVFKGDSTSFLPYTESFLPYTDTEAVTW